MNGNDPNFTNSQAYLDRLQICPPTLATSWGLPCGLKHSHMFFPLTLFWPTSLTPHLPPASAISRQTHQRLCPMDSCQGHGVGGVTNQGCLGYSVLGFHDITHLVFLVPPAPHLQMALGPSYRELNSLPKGSIFKIRPESPLLLSSLTTILVQATIFSQ